MRNCRTEDKYQIIFLCVCVNWYLQLHIIILFILSACCDLKLIIRTCMNSKLHQSCPVPYNTMSCMQPVRLLCPWHSPGKNTGVCFHVLLQEIFPTQELNQHPLYLLHQQVAFLKFFFILPLAPPVQPPDNRML